MTDDAQPDEAEDVVGKELQTGAPLSLHDLKASIAIDLAAGIATSEEIRTKFGITEAQWEVMKRNPLFRSMVGEAVREIQGSINAKKRTQLKAAMALEDAIIILYKIANDREAPAASRVAAVSELSKLAGHGAKEGEGKVASGFSVVINVGGDTPVTISGTSAPEAA